MSGETIRVGDRVRVRPRYRELGHLVDGRGTVEQVLDAPGLAIDGALYVRLDQTKELLACGSGAVERCPSSPVDESEER